MPPVTTPVGSPTKPGHTYLMRAEEAEAFLRDPVNGRDGENGNERDESPPPHRRRGIHLSDPKKPRTNHLGMNTHSSRRSRIKYACSLTIVYDSEQIESQSEANRMALLRETRKFYDISIEALHGMFTSFSGVIRQGRSLIGPKTFRIVLGRHGLRDAVIQHRLFVEFSDLRNPDKLDFRRFLRELSRLADEPIEAKLAFLFDVRTEISCFCMLQDSWCHSLLTVFRCLACTLVLHAIRVAGV